jgi:23S rRNA (uracil1939-C5)-methyltransferase
VCGRYVVRVEALAPTGEAQARVVATLAAPPAEELARVYGPRTPQLVEVVSLIGGLPDEVLEIEARWTLPRLGRRPARRVPPPRVRILRVIEAAPERVVPRCPVFGECGGCQLQHMAYAEQLAWKTARLRDALVAVGFDAPPMAEAIGCEPPWGYRNHMRFSVNRNGVAGLTARASRRVLPLRACPIAHPRIEEALAALVGEPLQRPQLLLRYGVATGQLLMQPVPSEAARGQLAALGFDPRAEDFEEELLGARFRIRPSSFFQTNSAHAERMGELVRRALPTGPNVTLVDAYCGVGTFARLLAGMVTPASITVGRVIAIEESASAVRDARWNLRDLPNVEVVQAKVETVLPTMTERLDGLVIDPPRAGCQRTVLDAMAACRVPRVVYVSCDPDTLARDLAYLCLQLAAYRLVDVQPLDMFPQTAHIETVVTLEAR